eukprot:2019527-Pleurochrysis_carterae.AAC.1
MRLSVSIASSPSTPQTVLGPLGGPGGGDGYGKKGSNVESMIARRRAAAGSPGVLGHSSVDCVAAAHADDCRA